MANFAFGRLAEVELMPSKAHLVGFRAERGISRPSRGCQEVIASGIVTCKSFGYLFGRTSDQAEAVHDVDYDSAYGW